MLKLINHPLEAIPPLAWLCLIDLEQSEIIVWHGKSVAATDQWFFDGVWAGDFSKGDFVNNLTTAGSGLRIDGEKAILVPPSYWTEGLFYKSLGKEKTLAANSLSLMLAALGDRFPPVGRHAWGMLTDVRFGLSFYKRRIPTMKGELRRTYWHPIVVDKTGYHELPIADAPAFNSYQDYRDFLSSQLALLFANGRDSKRPSPFTPLVTLSSGYDSTGIAALTRPLGCDQAVGVSTTRAYFGEDSDSGAEVAKYLNMDYEAFDRDAYKRRSDAIEAIFLACGASGEDFVFSAFEKRLPGTIVMTGIHGDLVWSRPKTLLRTEKGFSGISGAGSSLTEYRLQHGFVHLPVPYIGCQDLHQISDISNSEEMQPYSVGGDYDRPIPRRIAEEAGVPRTAFGQKKKAVSQPLARRDVPMSDASENDFAAYIASHNHEIPRDNPIKRLAWDIMDKMLKRFEWRIRKFGEKGRRRIFRARALLQRHKPAFGPKGLLHRWAIDKRIAYYRRILDKNGWRLP